MFEDCEIASAEERGKNEVLRKLSREIWLKMVDVIADSPIGKQESDTNQTIRITKFDAYGEIRDLVDSMITDEKDYVNCKSYAIDAGLISSEKEDHNND